MQDSKRSTETSKKRLSVSKTVKLDLPKKETRMAKKHNTFSHRVPHRQQSQPKPPPKFAQLKIPFVQLAYLKKVAQKLHFFLPSQKLKFLKSSKLELVQDLTNYEYLDKMRQCNKEKAKINKLLDKLCIFPTIQPHSKLKLIWDFIVVISILYYFFIIPLGILVWEGGQQDFGPLFDIANMFCLIVHILDMPIKANAQFYKKWKLVKDRYQIFSSYMKEWFLPDLLALIIIIVGLYTKERGFQVTGLIYYVKIIILKKKLQNFEYYFVIHRRLRVVIQLILLELFNIFIIHVLACIWVFTHRKELENNGEDYVTWATAKDPESGTELYFLGIYFATATLTTVGYGDVSAQNQTEYILAIISMFIGTGIFAYSISLIGSLISEMNQLKENAKKRMYIISTFMQQKNINQNLQNDIREYLEYLQENDNIKDKQEESDIIEELPDALKLQLRSEVYKHVVKIFENNFSSKFRQKLLDIIEETNFKPDEIIYDPEENSDKSYLYFLNKGKAKVIGSQSYSGYQHKLKLGEVFGLAEFFSGSKPNSTVKSVQFSQILTIEKQQFLNLLKQFPLDYQRYCQIKDEVNINNDMSKLPIQCFLCGRKHLLRQCGVIHYDKVSAGLKCMKLYKNQMKQDMEQERQQMPKGFRDIQKFKTLKDINYVRYDQFVFLEDNWDMCELQNNELVKYFDEDILKEQRELLQNEPYDKLAYNNFPIQDIIMGNAQLQPQSQFFNFNNQKENSYMIVINSEKNLNFRPSPKRFNKGSFDIELEEFHSIPLRKNTYTIKNNEQQKLKKYPPIQQQYEQEEEQEQQLKSLQQISDGVLLKPQKSVSQKLLSPLLKQQVSNQERERKASQTFKKQLMQLYNQQSKIKSPLEVGNKQVKFIYNHDMDQMQTWQNYFQKFNFCNIQFKINDGVQKRLLRLNSSSRRKTQKYYSKLKILSPQRSHSQPIHPNLNYNQNFTQLLEYQKKNQETYSNSGCENNVNIKNDSKNTNITKQNRLFLSEQKMSSSNNNNSQINLNSKNEFKQKNQREMKNINLTIQKTNDTEQQKEDYN